MYRKYYQHYFSKSRLSESFLDSDLSNTQLLFKHVSKVSLLVNHWYHFHSPISAQSMDTIILMNRSRSSMTSPETISTTTMQQTVDPLSTPGHCYKRSTSHQTSLSDSSVPSTPLSTNNGFFRP